MEFMDTILSGPVLFGLIAAVSLGLVARALTGVLSKIPGLRVQMEQVQRNLDEAAANESIDLTTSLNQLAQAEQYLAFEVLGSRHNISYKYGLLFAQLAISLRGQDRDRVLSELVTLLAQN